MKPFLTDKVTSTSKITLIENDKLIANDQDIADKFSNFFENAVNSLDIKRYKTAEYILINPISLPNRKKYKILLLNLTK